MFDDVDRLRGNDSLVLLLAHYAQLGEQDRDIWQNRLMALTDVAPAELSKLHGELLAFEWIEQNTGNAPGLKAGTVPACYRVTAGGLRALRQTCEESKDPSPPIEKDRSPRSPRRRREKNTSAERLVAATS
jgi:hypothetical protein